MNKNMIKRDIFQTLKSISTRWMDNDVYGHINNVIYYSFFDTAVNQILIEQGLLDVVKSPVIGLVVETGCRYYSSLTFPDTVHAGVSVSKIGTSSVRYEIALFRNDEQQAAAEGFFVHVYVDRSTNRPVPIPDATRQYLKSLMTDAPATTG